MVIVRALVEAVLNGALWGSMLAALIWLALAVSRRTSASTRFLVWWLALAGWWLLLVGTNMGLEELAAACAATLGTLLAVAIRRRRLLVFRFERRWLARAALAPVRMVQETGIVLWALALHLAMFGRGVATVLIASLLVAVLLVVTFDLDRPTRGLIRVPATPLVDVGTSMTLPPVAAAGWYCARASATPSTSSRSPTRSPYCAKPRNNSKPPGTRSRQCASLRSRWRNSSPG